MKHLYTNDREGEDANKISEAFYLLQNGSTKKALPLFEQVLQNTPNRYVYQYEEKDILYVKFWDQQEFEHFVTWGNIPPPSIRWIVSAYPKGYYYLAILLVRLEQYAKALEMLERGQALEPTNPKFINEIAHIHASMGNYQKAMTFYDQIGDLNPYISLFTKAITLRGKGFLMIEMGQLDKAESFYKESLLYEPVNDIALNQIEYISQLHTGGQTFNPKRMLSITGTGVSKPEAEKSRWQFWK